MDSLFFELIRVSLGIQKSLSRVPTTKEWENLFELSTKQTLVGICAQGVKQLYKDPRYANTISRTFLLKWLGIETVIKERNQIVNKQCVRLINFFTKQGFACSILKGQGLAALYRNDNKDLRLFRQSGDIDLWVGGGRKKVMKFISQLFEEYDYDYKNAHASFYSDTEVEVHWIPDILMNLYSNAKLQKLWRENEDKLSSDAIELPENTGVIKVPSVAMNLFYVLLHCYRHLFEGGVGLRQVMDYYFVLQQSVDPYSREETMKLVYIYGMKKFTAAMMWIMLEVFHASEDNLLCPPDKKEGLFLLNEIMLSGNFGHHDARFKEIGHNKQVRTLTHNLQRAPHLIYHYPKEVLWAPVWMAFHFVWKRTVGKR
jgi:hypothetical protein